MLRQVAQGAILSLGPGRGRDRVEQGRDASHPLNASCKGMIQLLGSVGANGNAFTRRF